MNEKNQALLFLHALASGLSAQADVERGRISVALGSTLRGGQISLGAANGEMQAGGEEAAAALQVGSSQV